MQLQEKQHLIAYLSQFVTAARQQTLQAVLQKRSRHVTVILEDIYQPHNASACLRSCDSFGIQDVHIIENRNDFNLNPEVSVGSERWLTLYRYNQPKINNSKICLETLKNQGYKILATTPREDATPLEQVPIEEKLGLMFGTELNGLSDYAFSQADHFVRIPMVGFSESFNISVSVALCLYDITTRLRKSNINWGLSEIEQAEIQIKWLRQSIRGGELIEQKFINQCMNES
ncbi:MAG: RNA methyltransferase [Cyanobacteriota bacterium]|nr:RNA methyltransferase [Cyanobacteriota bacterium]